MLPSNSYIGYSWRNLKMSSQVNSLSHCCCCCCCFNIGNEIVGVACLFGDCWYMEVDQTLRY